MTVWIYTWKNGWKGWDGQYVVNNNLFQSLERLVGWMMEEYGILVQFRKVERNENLEADRLAKRACGI
jgi:ribonuclease HI